MMNVENSRPNYEDQRPAKKALNFHDHGKLKLTRRPLGGRNTINEEALAVKVAAKSTFDLGKAKKDDVDAKSILARKAKGLLYKKRKPQPEAFSVPIPKTIPVPIQEASADLTKLSCKIDTLLAAVPEGVTKVDLLGSCSFSSPAYAQDIINYNMERERKFALSPNFLEASNIKAHSRGVLVDWITQVQAHANIQTDSLHIAIALLDQMLAKRPISLSRLQLIGITCLFIACKINERFPPEIEELLRLTEDAYTRNELLAAERLVLKSVGFDLYIPTPLTFIDRCVQASEKELGENSKQVKFMALYLLQLGLTDARFSAILPSKRAAAAFWLARKLLLPPTGSIWNQTLRWYSTYEERDIWEVLSQVAKMCLKAPESRFQGARTKYSSSRYGRISHHPSVNQASLLKRIACY